MPDFCLKGGKVLRSIEIPYGRGRQIFHIEDHRLTGVLMPETMPKAGEETEIVRRAISAPIDSARLSTLSQTAERILLITSDHTLIAAMTNGPALRVVSACTRKIRRRRLTHVSRLTVRRPIR